MRHHRLWPSFCACLLAGAWWDVSWARAADAPSGLAKTQWRLVEFQPADAAQGSRRPAAPSRYVLRLDADGTATLWLNCNRVTGTWVAQPAGKSAAGAASGVFRFDHFPTRMLACPAPGMEEEMLRQVPNVRSFMMRQGRLQLGLMADSGRYVWSRDALPGAPAAEPAAAPAAEPVTAPAAAAPQPAQTGADWQVTRRVNLREQPSTQARVLALLPPGTRMLRSECKSAEGREWCRVTLASGGEGFVAAEYLQPVPAKARR